MWRKTLFALVLGVVVSCSPARAQWVTDLSVGSIYDSNADGVYAGEGARITHMALDVARQSANARLYYSGDGFMFGQSGPRTFIANRIGMDMIYPLGTERNRVVLGFAATNRLNRSYYNIYDYLGATGYVQGKWYVKQDVMLKLGYNMDWRSYQNLDVSRYVDHSFSAQVSRFLPSRTTLQADAQFGYKLRDSAESQVVLGLQVAQSLTRNTGLSLRYQARFNTTAQQDALSAILRSFTDEDILNSRYDYGGHRFTAKLTQQLPSQIRLIAEGGYEVRSYTDEFALDLTGNLLDNADLRNDRNSFLDVDLELPLTEKLTTSFGYSFSHLRSNDAYYNYGARHSLAASFRVGF
ncbi:MAG: hypothetical protein HN521_10390 [Candidatus Latescibacteria bacterium]|jgi:hypothetical protein|nr:hypothetical protein [Candidatus Latescibacterota bacterium]